MKRTLSTRFTSAYGCKHPIAAAGMAFAGMGAGFVKACADSGIYPAMAAVGVIPPELVAISLKEVRASGVDSFNLNFITPYCTDAHIDLCVRERIPVVSFHWGIPAAPWMNALRAAGCKVWLQVGSAEEAVAAVKAGADLIVAQGSEAGGHNRGILPTFVLVREVVDALADHGSPLVLAAGGITDGRAVAAALALGADGAWIGTRLVATQESEAHVEYKRRIVTSSGNDTVLTHLFGRHHPDFNPMRVLRNRVVTEWHDRSAEVPADNSGEPTIGQMTVMGQMTPLKRFTNLVPMRDATGDFEELPLLAGQGIASIRDVPTMRTAIDQMMAQACESASRLGKALA